MKRSLATLLLFSFCLAPVFGQDEKPKKKKNENAAAEKDRTQMTKQELFKDADTDGSGGLSLEEYTAKIIAMAKQAEVSFKKFDKDENSTLSPAEFDEAIEEVNWYKLSRKTADEWFAELDGDKNSEVNFEEFKGVVKGKAAEAMFARADKDGSGSLSQEEFKTYLDSVTKGKGGGKGKKKQDV